MDIFLLSILPAITIASKKVKSFGDKITKGSTAGHCYITNASIVLSTSLSLVPLFVVASLKAKRKRYCILHILLVIYQQFCISRRISHLIDALY